MTQEFHPGSAATMTCSFYVGTALTDPTTITLKVMSPDGTVTTYTHPATITRVSTGIYTKDVTLTVEGSWWWRWEGTGSAQATDEGWVECIRSPFV